MDFKTIRDLFPITKTIIRHDEKSEPLPLVYMDHAASTHAPKPVLDKYVEVMETSYANIHRGEHRLSCLSTEHFEEVPHTIAKYLGINDLANSGYQTVFSSNTTSSLDLASHLFAEKEGKVLSTLIEHHSNDLPHRGRGPTAHIGILENGMLDLDDYEKKLESENIKLVAVSAGSNVTGYMPPIHKMARMAHDAGAKILVDAAQRLAHYKLEVKPIDHPEHLDFVAAAGHKTYSPFGASFLLGDTEIFDEAPPYLPSGGTVSLVTEDASFFLKGPDRHTFGTPNIAGSIAFGESVQFLQDIGIDRIREHEIELLDVMMKGLNDIEGITVYGDIPAKDKLGVVTFNIKDYYHANVSHDLDKIGGIATRNGCFCAHPYLLRLLNVLDDEDLLYQMQVIEGKESKRPGAVRASIGIYNTREEVDHFLDVVEQIAKSH
ncbi:MAG: aminotransferase class V-fold PLP-dependent enzyme [Candidatus Heimdallarchaeota archaeon]|nr:aminotransferase class V-fold PLP-dependent enzyme [Candidatus Heimdallarchaeota archaeon]